MKLLRATTAAALAMSAAAVVPATAATATAAPATPAGGEPQVLPLLQHWSGSDGSFTLTSSARIVVDPAQAPALGGDARTFANDLAALGAGKIPVVVGTPDPGDISLTAGSDGAGEGFALTVTPGGLTIDGDGPAGTFYGEQAVEQMIKAAPGHATVAAGTDRDEPSQSERGLMIDTARKYWSVTSIEQVIRRLAWMRMNTLHWHITDSEFFRLDLPGYPGLAAARSYTPSDIQQVESYAARYHVRLLPEVDIPGHSTALTAYRPSLRWTCPSMNEIISPGRIDPGFTVDITKPANVAFLDGLVQSVVRLFPAAPVIHLGGDETPQTALQAQCPELTGYAAQYGYAKTEDVFLAFENHLDDLVRADSKRLEIWGWWPQAGGSGSVTLNKDVLVQAWLGDESSFIAQGYDVVVSNEHSLLYVVPKYAPGTGNGNYIPDDGSLWDYSVNPSPQVAGAEMAEWGDNAYTMPDAYPLNYLRRPLQVFSAVAWGSPRSGSYLDYEQMADAIGTPPDVPEVVDPAARPLSGTPFGDAGAANAFDGSPSTSWVATADGAEAGLDLGPSGATRLAGVRLLPRSNSSADLASLVGGTVQGCTDGPDAGCHTLATVQWTPTQDWVTLPAGDAGTYRWVKFAGAASAEPVLAEVQFLASPADVPVTVQSPATLAAPGATRVGVRVTNHTSQPLNDVAVQLSATNELDNTALTTPTPQRLLSVAPGASVTAAFQVTVPGGAAPGRYRLAATADYHASGSSGSDRAVGTSSAEVPLASLAQAYNNVGVTSDDDPEPGDIDGAQSSFSAQGLAAAGVQAGRALTAGGFTFGIPRQFAGTEDNAVAHGQVIPLHGPASRIGLLVTGTYAPAAGLPGTVTVGYTDGTSTSAAVTVPDWSAASPPAGVSLGANGGTVNGDGRAQTARPANLYVLSVPADPGKQLASVTLPAGPAYLGAKTPAIHVFGVATSG